MFRLSDVLVYDSVVIQCHNVPDVDAIASGYALLRYLRDKGKPCRLVYGGFARISKPNIAEFVRVLDIPVEYVGKEPVAATALAPKAENPLLITVDCQYGAGNVMRIESENVCVIDHHLQEKDLPPLSLVEPYLGSCATVVWRLLLAEGFDFAANKGVSTALYYGLYTDTNSLSEIFHPVDRDMLESLDFDQEVIRWLKNNNLTRDELVIAGNALIETRYDKSISASVFMAEPCDPNILGFISDLTMQAEGVSVCVGFNQINGGVKLSIRSATYEVMANELAAFLTEGYGSGGGNKEKAGGFMNLPESCAPMDYLMERLRAYFASYDKMVAGEYVPDVSAMKVYAKKPVPVGYVVMTDLFPEGTQVLVRTLEGDALFPVTKDSYVMIGIMGEAYPIDRKKFEKSYEVLPGEFSFMPHVVNGAFYHPTAKDRLYDKTVQLAAHARPCVGKGQSRIYARPLARNSKVFAEWYKEGYMFGAPGDWLAARLDDPSDVYVINRDIFGLTYEEVER